MLQVSSHYPKSFSFEDVLLSANESPSIISSLQLGRVCRFTAVINQGTGGGWLPVWEDSAQPCLTTLCLKKTVKMFVISSSNPLAARWVHKYHPYLAERKAGFLQDVAALWQTQTPALPSAYPSPVTSAHSAVRKRLKEGALYLETEQIAPGTRY